MSNEDFKQWPALKQRKTEEKVYINNISVAEFRRGTKDGFFYKCSFHVPFQFLIFSLPKAFRLMVPDQIQVSKGIDSTKKESMYN